MSWGRRPTVVRLLVLAALVVILLVLERLFGLSSLVSPTRLEGWLERAGPWGPIVLVVAMAVAVVVSPIPSLPLDILAGRAFGPLLGTLYSALGALLGAVASFQIARLLGREVVARFLKGHIYFCQRCSDKLLTKVVFFSRLLPFVSFDLVSYGAGLTKMSLLKFALASFLGLLPLSFVYTSYGSVLVSSEAAVWIGGGVVVALFFVLPRWIERYDLLSMRQYFAHDRAEGSNAGASKRPQETS